MMLPTGSGPELMEGGWRGLETLGGVLEGPGLRLEECLTHSGSASPCRFWASVEPYCADITSEEVRTLEELLKPPEDEAEHYKIPPLGKHYSQRWAQEDLLEEQKDGARAAAVADKKKGLIGPLTELDTKGKPQPPYTQAWI